MFDCGFYEAGNHARLVLKDVKVLSKSVIPKDAILAYFLGFFKLAFPEIFVYTIFYKEGFNLLIQTREVKLDTATDERAAPHTHRG